MGSTNTANALSRTTINVMEGDMSWEELYKELKPDIPFDKAKTVRMIVEETGEGENWIRTTLDKKVKNEDWGKEIYKGVAYYWPPE